MVSAPNQAKPTTRGPVLGIAIVAGLIAAILTYVYLTHVSANREPVAASGLVSVVVASKNIPARALITDDVLSLRSVPISQAPADHASTLLDVSGKITTSPISAGQAITQSLLVRRGVEMGLTPMACRRSSVPSLWRSIL